MIYESDTISCKHIEDGIVELTFDSKVDSVNKFNKATMDNFLEAVTAIKADGKMKALLVTSGKDTFIVGADITEFLGYFSLGEAEMINWLKLANVVFNEVEDLDVPTVTAINGYALGGGLEMALSTCYRTCVPAAKVGVPETKLGIYPGFGGTVRLSRLIGADNAIEWIAGGKENRADAALAVGAVDTVVAPEKLREVSITLLKRAMAGELDWKARREEKKAPLKLSDLEQTMVFEGAKGFVSAQAGPNYPSPVKAIEMMAKGATKSRDEALIFEHEGFAKMTQTVTAKSLISLFLGDQYLKKYAKNALKTAAPVKKAAVLGAGIMGGGVAYQSASKGIPIVMKDINDAALKLGLDEASKILDKKVSKKHMTPAKMAGVLNSINATLSYDELKDANIIVEAVIEKTNIKQAVLQEVEKVVAKGTILTSNTSTISITTLAEGLERPEDFCGMHFFNPVHKMPLVEVIRGAKSSEKAIATTVAYASKMGKTPIVVNDCPGFLVNRILFPYFSGFSKLLEDGVDYKRIDKVMEKFGWPMGPAYLLDVVGIDTANHAGTVMAAGFPDRMQQAEKTTMSIMYDNKRYGQKNGKGFYLHQLDKKGRLKKVVDPEVEALIAPVVKNKKEVSDQEIIERMMIPLVYESSRCLEDNITETATEVDMSLIYGLGFPPFRGGPLRYADDFGIGAMNDAAKKYASLGKIYEPTAQILDLAKNNKNFH